MRFHEVGFFALHWTQTWGRKEYSDVHEYSLNVTTSVMPATSSTYTKYDGLQAPKKDNEGQSL